MKIYASQIEDFEKAIAKTNKKLAKFGYEDVIKLVIERYFTKTMLTEDGRKVQIKCAEVSLDGPSFVEGGARLVAVIDHAKNGNVVRVAARDGETVELDSKWWSAAGNCDHCGTNRKRNRTILVDDSGELKQVGASCVCAYTGHGGASSVLRAFWAMYNQIDGSGFEERSYSSSFEVFSPLEVIAAAAVVSDHGKDNFEKGEVSACLYRATDIKKKPIYREPNDADFAFAEAALEWAKTEFTAASTNDYGRNLASCLSAEITNMKHLGYVSSVVKVYSREMGLRAARAHAPVKTNEHFGTKGERIIFELVLVGTPGYASQFGYVTIHKMEDADGRTFIWKTTSCLEDVKIGDTVKLKGTIKGHSDYNGLKQTELSRCAVI